MNPKISVIMPVYNEIKSLKRSIDSILMQTYTDFEFIIINEAASDDGSKELIEKYMEMDARVKLIQKTVEKKGVATSLNLGINAARGEFIARMDADDYSYPERFSKQVHYLEEHPDIVLCGTQYNIITPGKHYHTKLFCKPEEIKAGFLFFNHIGHPTVMFRRNAFKNQNWLYDESQPAEDYHLWMKVIKKEKIVNLDEVLLDYYVGFGNNITVQKKDVFRDNSLDLIAGMLKNTLNIDAGKYDRHVFQLTLKPFSGKRDLMLDLFYLLQEIEEKNKKMKFFNDCALCRVLCRQWNAALKVFYVKFSDINMDLRLPEVESNDEKSFIELIEQAMNLSKEEIGNYIKHLIVKIVTMAEPLKKIIVFGTGAVCKEYFCLENINKIDVVAFADNDETKQNNILLNKKIIHPKNINTVAYDAVIIATTKYSDEIYKQLTEKYSIPRGKVFFLGLLNFI